MIQFNLLPDVKLAFIKAERQKHLVITIATISSIVAICIFSFLLVTVKVFQQKHLGDLSKDIKSTTQKVQSKQDLNSILTVQSQLNSLSTLHNDKLISSRLYEYLSKLTPVEVSMSDVKVDLVANTLEITGKVPTFAIVQKFADTFKYTTYRPEDKKMDKNYVEPALFANVVLSSFARQKNEAQYTLKMNIDPLAFSNTKVISVTVPSITSTDTNQARPTPLFQPAPVEGTQAAPAPTEGQ